MGIHKGQFEADSVILEKEVVLEANDVPNSASDALMDSFKPGYDFIIKSIQVFAEAVTATADYMVKIGTTDAMAARETPTADTREDATLHGTEANLIGGADEEINLHCTTDASGDFTGLKVKVTIRPHPAGGEAGA